MTRRVDLNDLRLLSNVADHGTISAAARAGSVPKSTISQRIAVLERVVGTGLIRRTSRSLSLTEAGELILPQARAIERLARQLEDGLPRLGEASRSVVRVACSPELARHGLSAVLPAFLARNADATVRFEARRERVDPDEDGFDLAVVASDGAAASVPLRASGIAECEQVLVASPDWIARHPALRDPEDLPPRDALGRCDDPAAGSLSFERGAERRDVNLSPRALLDDTDALCGSATAGGGFACVPAFAVRDELAAGRLVALMPDWSLPRLTVSIRIPRAGFASQIASRLAAFLAGSLPDALSGTRQSAVPPFGHPAVVVRSAPPALQLAA